MTLMVRNEIPTDAPAIAALINAAFRDVPHASHHEAAIVRALRMAGRLTHSLVAEEGGHCVGHVALSPVTIEDGTLHWYGLGPISVAPMRQRQGIGTQLMAQALTALREQSAAGCVLVGDPVFYRRFGFVRASHMYVDQVPPEYVQALAFTELWPRGRVWFDPAFEAKC